MVKDHGTAARARRLMALGKKKKMMMEGVQNMMERKKYRAERKHRVLRRCLRRLSDVELVGRLDALMVLGGFIGCQWPGSACRAGTLCVGAVHSEEPVPRYLPGMKLVRLWLWYFAARRVDVQLIRHC
jgi:hypothetical protein